MPGIWVYRSMGAGGNAKIRDLEMREVIQAAATQNLQARAPAMAAGRGVAVSELRGDQRQRVILGIAKPRPDSGEKGHWQSSGSEHEPSSVCLAAMVHDFMEEQPARNVGSKDSAKDRIKEELGGEVLEILKGLVPCASEIELVLAAQAAKAVSQVRERASQICKDDGADCTSGCLRRAAMKFLREAGYNAAICKSRWDHAGGFPAGDYEYMDVLIEKESGMKPERLIVDVDFRGQFEIARPTERYTSISQELPNIFVGTPERLQQIVNLMSRAIKQSLKKREMPVPPWRKPDYMRAKWFSAYKRTSNDVISRHETSEAAVHRELGSTAMRGSRWESSRRFAAAFDAHQERKPRSDEITAVMTDWKPPAVSMRRSQKPGRVAGLASVLIEAGLSTLAKQKAGSSSESECRKLNNLVAVS